MKKNLEEYEKVLENQGEQELQRKKRKQQLQLENEERDIELQKMRVDQLFQEQVDSYRRQVQ